MKRSLLLATLCLGLLAQDRLTFEVASIKPRPRGALISMIGGEPSGPTLTLHAMSLVDLVAWANNVKPWQVVGGPAWSGIQKDRTMLGDTTRFDIVAKADGDQARPLDDFRRMLQSLLADRFHLSLHREPRDTPVYALVIDKNGPKFHESAPDAKGILRMRSGGNITASGGTMKQLADWFSNANGVDRPVIDETGLTGRYDFTLEWSGRLSGDAADTARPSIFTAMPEQLGLKLVPRRRPVDFLVIDSAQMPSEN